MSQPDEFAASSLIVRQDARYQLLLVDDSAMNLDTLLATLGDSYELRFAIDGETALDLIADGFLPDLILLDIMMPVMDGYEVCRRLKSDSTAQHIPVIFLTSLDNADDEEKGLDLGASDYITKPFNPAIVKRRVQIQLELKQHRDQLQNRVDDKSRKLEQSRRDLVNKDAHLQSILKSAPVGIGLIVDRKLKWVNQRMEEMVGYTNGELEGRNARLLYQTDEEYERVGQEKYAQIDQQGTGSVDTQFIAKDGSIMDVFLSSTPLDVNDLSVGVIFTALDITERKELQKEQNRFNRLASIGVLAAGIAHEINNPNGLILYNSEILRNVFKELIPYFESNQSKEDNLSFGGLAYGDIITNVPEMFADMYAAAQRIKQIVAELRDFSRSDNSDGATLLDLNQIVRSSLHLVENTVNMTTDNLHVSLADDLPSIQGIGTRLEQVMINLLLNASQALDHKSQAISVRSEYDQEQKLVRLLVEDEGCGIAAEIIDSIIEPFVTTKREHGGTGLGLSVSARIVKAHNGRLRFESTPGVGTTVSLELPVVGGEQDAIRE
ncbi:MAG: response regulator [Desulfuromusa sp.]|nr:response regulator [Desulfuromusa sp.]